MASTETLNVFCRHCGRKCLTGDRFCPSCGQLLFPDGDEGAAEAATPTAATPTAATAAGTTTASVCPRETGTVTADVSDTPTTADKTAPSQTFSPYAAPTSGESAAVYGAPAAAPMPVRAKKPRSPMVTRILSVRFFRNAAILLLSMFVLLAAFLPVVRVQSDDLSYGITGVEIRYGGIDAVLLTADSLHKDTKDEIMDSKLYRRYEEVYDEGKEAFDGVDDIDRFDQMSRKQQKLFVQMVKLLTRIGARSENVAFSPATMIAAIAFVLYALFALGFFVVALLQFLLWLLRGRSIGGAAGRMLCFVPGATLALHFAFRLFMGNLFKTSPAGSIVAAIVAALVLLIASMVTGLVTKEIRLRVGSSVRAVFTATCALVLLSVLLLSPLSVRLTGKLRQSSSGTPSDTVSTVKVKIGWDFFDSISMTEEQIDKSEDVIESSLSSLGYFTRSSFVRQNEGAVSALDTAIAYVLRMATSDGRGVGVFAYVPVLAFLAVLAGAWMMEESLLYFVVGGEKRLTCLLSRVTVIVTVLLLLVALIVTVIVCNVTIDNTFFRKLADDAVFGSTVGSNGAVRKMLHHLQPTAAPIVATAFAVVSIAIPSPGEKRRKQMLPL